MIAKTSASLLLALAFSLCPLSAFAQSQTTGRIAGTVKDQNGRVIVGAEVTVVSKATGDEREANADKEGNYAVPLLPPGAYRVKLTAHGFNSILLDSVQVIITETTPLDVTLAAAGPIIDPVVVRIAPLIQR